jgi:hypothetical protein
MLLFCADCYLLLSSFLSSSFFLLLISFTNRSSFIGHLKSIPAYDSNSPSLILVHFSHVLLLASQSSLFSMFTMNVISVNQEILVVTEYTKGMFGETDFFVGNHNTNSHFVLCQSYVCYLLLKPVHCICVTLNCFIVFSRIFLLSTVYFCSRIIHMQKAQL